MAINAELLESLTTILTTSLNVLNRDSDCLMHLVNKYSSVDQTCSGVSCNDCIFSAENYDQTMKLITTMEGVIKLEELIK